jgi:diacylglycerol kinase family enzyme
VTNFDHIIVLLNPAGTSAKQSLQRLHDLQALFPRTTVDIVYTSSEGRTANQELIAAESARLGPDTLLCVVGGDGTVGMAVETLLMHPHLPENARQTTLLPFWGGNANDLANMLNGSASSMTLKQLFERAKRVPIRPLQLSLTDKEGATRVHLAICYASFGGTALATKKISEPSHRRHPLRKFWLSRWLLESATIFSAFVKSPGFVIEEDGRQRTIYERAISNGARFAKIERVPVNLDDDAFFMYTAETRGLLSTPLEVMDSTRSQTAGNFHKKRASFVIKDATLAQFDGEPHDIPAGTTVTVELSKQPLNVLSTRLVS